MTQDEVLFQKHLSDLAGTADRRGFAVFTDFMNLNELNIFHASAQKKAGLPPAGQQKRGAGGPSPPVFPVPYSVSGMG